MGAERRDIRRLALRAGSRDAVRRALPEIGEAFRIAGFPGLPRHGVVLVRRLDLGRIGAGTTRHALARRLDALSFAIPPVICRAGSRPPDTPALAWPDWVEAIAAARIAQAAGASAWWVRQVLAPTPAGNAAAAVVAALSRRADEGLPQAPARYVLRLLDLGAADLAAADLPAIVRRWPEPAPKIAASGLFPDLRSRRSALPLSAEATAAAAVPASVEFAARALVQALPARRRAALALLLARPDIAAADALWVVQAAVVLDRGAAALPEIARRLATEVAEPVPFPPRAVSSLRPPRADAVAAKAAARPAETSPPPDAPAAKSSEPTRPPSGTDPQAALPAPLPAGGTALATRAGGFVQIVNLLAAAGIETMERTAGVSLALRLAHLFLARGAAGDPLATLLPEPPEGAPDFPERLSAFLPEPTALHLAGCRLALLRIEAAPGLRALVLARPLLAVAVLDAAALARLRHVLPAGQIVATRATAISRAALAAGLLPGLAVLVQRLAVRLAGTGWRRTIRRNGWAEATATHLDLTLDLDDVRIAERRSGLDRNPGWVIWLGLVVMLHFQAFRKPRIAPLPGEGR